MGHLTQLGRYAAESTGADQGRHCVGCIGVDVLHERAIDRLTVAMIAGSHVATSQSPNV